MFNGVVSEFSVFASPHLANFTCDPEEDLSLDLLCPWNVLLALENIYVWPPNLIKFKVDICKSRKDLFFFTVSGGRKTRSTKSKENDWGRWKEGQVSIDFIVKMSKNVMIKNCLQT